MIRWLDRRLRGIADEYAPGVRYLAIVRIAFAVQTAVGLIDLRWVADAPPGSFNPPPGPFALLPAPPGEAVLLGLMGATLVLAVLVGVGAGTRPASFALSAALVTSQGIAYSFSKVDHFIVVAVAPVFLALAGWGGAWSVDARLRRRRGSPAEHARPLPILLLAVTIGWAMLTAAIPKARGGWLDPSRFATRGFVARDIALGEKLGPLGPQLLAIDNGAFWKLLDYATLIVEGGLLLAVLVPVVFRAWLVLAAGFHAGVFVSLGIDFSSYLVVYAVFFSPVAAWLAVRIGGVPLPARRAKLDPAS